jgi:hypothetical protein
MGFEFVVTDADGGTQHIPATELQAQEVMAACKAWEEGTPAEKVAAEHPGASFNYRPSEPDRVEVDDDGATHEFFDGAA